MNYHKIILLRALISLCFLSLAACSTTKNKEESDVEQEGFKLSSLVKSDLNEMMEVNIIEIRSILRELTAKLYLRNPRELKKSSFPSAKENINRIFSRTTNWSYREIDGVFGTEAINLSLRANYEEDRVFAFMMGLTSMLMSSYEYKTEFFMFDSIDPQGLYNSARNIEIAVWKLSNNSDAGGELLILSNSMREGDTNLSYERLFGKLIAMQDIIAIVVAGKTNRTISKVVQRMATAIFLPIP
jgi:hypothetical protein